MANAIIDTLRTKNMSGEERILYPRSKTSAISDDKGKNLDNIILELNEKLTDIKTSEISNDEGKNLDTIISELNEKIDNSQGGGFNDVYTETSINMGRKSNTTVGEKSVSIGDNNEASGYNSIALGNNTKASSDNSFSEGDHTVASGQFQHVQGKYNVEDTENKYAHIIGGGSEEQRKNIHTVDWDGNAIFAGEVTNGYGATLNGIETTTDTLLISNVESLISVISIKGTMYQNIDAQTLQYPLFTKININSDSKSCSATSSTQIMLFGMNDVYDIIEYDKLTRKFEKVVLNGTEDIVLDNITGCYIYTPSIAAKIRSVNIASDKYKYFDTNTYSTNYGIFILETGEIGIKHDGFSTVDEYKTWLSNNNVTIIYEKETEEVVDLEESFVDEIKKLKLFIGENTITTDSATIHPIIEFDYATSRIGQYVMELWGRFDGSSIDSDALSSILTTETF